MKKFLIFLLIFSNSVLAEKFFLVCKGDQQLVVNGQMSPKESKTFSIEINNTYAVFEDRKYKKNEYKDPDQWTNFNLDENVISFSYFHNIPGAREEFIMARLDRISGKAIIDKHFFTQYAPLYKETKYFDGNCKKTKKAF